MLNLDAVIMVRLERSLSVRLSGWRQIQLVTCGPTEICLGRQQTRFNCSPRGRCTGLRSSACLNGFTRPGCAVTAACRGGCNRAKAKRAASIRVEQVLTGLQDRPLQVGELLKRGRRAACRRVLVVPMVRGLLAGSIDSVNDVAYGARVITKVDQWIRRLRTVKTAYERWEQHQVARRFAGWSVPRRLVVFVVLPATMLCCGGGALGVPLLWFARETAEAGRGASAPVAAADEYLLRLSYGNDDGLLPLLDDDRQDQLLRQWHDYRDSMRSTDPAPFNLDLSVADAGSPAGDRSTVRIDVQAVWWSTDANGRTGGYKSKPRTWVIEVREDDGWRVSRVDAPPWCGPGGYVQRCGRAVASAPPTSRPSPSPSIDLLEHPREMLPCGKRDPFRELHSCPPTAEQEPR